MTTLSAQTLRWCSLDMCPLGRLPRQLDPPLRTALRSLPASTPPLPRPSPIESSSTFAHSQNSPASFPLPALAMSDTRPILRPFAGELVGLPMPVVLLTQPLSIGEDRGQQRDRGLQKCIAVPGHQWPGHGTAAETPDAAPLLHTTVMTNSERRTATELGHDKHTRQIYAARVCAC